MALHKSISRLLGKHRLTIKETGGLLVIGKASTLSSQLDDIAAHHRLGTCPMQDFQDVDASRNDYLKGVSFK